jgi:tetratricopeptide (TPR) repeat protein
MVASLVQLGELQAAIDVAADMMEQRSTEQSSDVKEALRRGLLAGIEAADRFDAQSEAELGNAAGISDVLRANALWLKGIWLGQVGRAAEERETLQILIDRFASSTNVRLREYWSRSVYNKGVLLRDEGRLREALATWEKAGVRAADSTVQAASGWEAKSMYAQAHLLMEMERWREAVDMVQRVRDLGGRDQGSSAKLLWADALGVERDSLARSDDLRAALRVDDEIVTECSRDRDFELRHRAMRALVHGLWVVLRLKQPEAAMQRADALMTAYTREPDPARLAVTSETVLSGASTVVDGVRALRWSPGRKSRQALRTQALQMHETVIARAREVGGEAGNAVVVAAKIGIAENLAKEGHLLAGFHAYETALSVEGDELAALETVESEMRRTGAESRLAETVLVRAFTLHELGRNVEALDAIDDLLSQLEQSTEARAGGTAAIVRGVRQWFRHSSAS